MENNNFNFNDFMNNLFGFMGSASQSEDKYLEIQKLHTMLEEADIPHKFCRQMDGYQVVYYGGPVPEPKSNAGNAWSSKGDAIEHMGSHGHEKDLLEVAGCLVKNEDECEEGYLTAEEVFQRIKEDYDKVKLE